MTCVYVKSLGVSLCDTMDCSLPGFSVQSVLQARILEWVASSSSGESSLLVDRTLTSMSPVLAGEFFTISATWETLLGPGLDLNLRTGW